MGLASLISVLLGLNILGIGEAHIELYFRTLKPSA
jgi:hypothetical protein